MLVSYSAKFLIIIKVGSLMEDRLNKRVLLPLFLVVVIDAMGMGILLPLLPFYAKHFNASDAVVGLLFASFSVCQLIAGPILGKSSDRFGRKFVLIFSQLGSFLSFLLLANASSLAMLFLARILTGFTSGNISVAIAYAIDSSSTSRRKQAIGIIGAAIGVGMVFGPSLSAFGARWGLQAPIWIAVGLSLLSLLVNIIFLPKSAPKQPSATRSKANSGWLKQPAVVSVLAILLLFYLTQGLTMSGLALFLSERFTINGHPFGQKEVAWVFILTGIMNIVVQMGLLRTLGEWFSDAKLSIIALLLMAISYFCLSFIGVASTLFIVLAVSSFGAALVRPILSSILSTAVPDEHQGLAMGVNQSIMAVANIIGPIISGELLETKSYGLWSNGMAFILVIAAILSIVFMVKRVWPKASLIVTPRRR